MEDLIGFLVIGLFMDVIFWGVGYLTGCLLMPIISLGKWQPESIAVDEENGKKRMRQNGFTLIEKSGQVYLGAFAVAFIGMVFWVCLIIVLSVT